jgi:signal transduction histidine kinase
MPKMGALSMERNESRETAFLISVFLEALNLDYALRADTDSFEPDSPQLLPQAVIGLLCKYLDADGGNFTVYDPESNLLQVRARFYVENSENEGAYPAPMNFSNFAQKMLEIGRDKNNRNLSSSYRCLDGRKAILIPYSSVDDRALQTLDIETLELRSGLSAIAAPLEFHGQLMGVLNLDVNNAEERSFNEESLRIVQAVTSLLPPVLHSSVLLDAQRRISNVVLSNGTDAINSASRYDTVCRVISESLFVSWVGLYLADGAVEGLYERVGSFGATEKISPVEALKSVKLNAETNRGLKLFLENQSFNGLQNNLENRRYDVDDLSKLCENYAAKGYRRKFKIFKMGGPTSNIEGFFIFHEVKQPNQQHSFIRLCYSMVEYVNLAISATKQFEKSTSQAFDIAAHELSRTLKLLAHQQQRLNKVTREISTAIRTENILDEYVAHELTTIKNANENQIETAQGHIEHVLEVISGNSRSRRRVTGGEYAKRLIEIARENHNRYESRERKRLLDLNKEINDLVRNYGKELRPKNVSYSIELEGNLPKRLEIEQQNFRTVFGNVLDNAVKYSRPGSNIKIVVVSEELNIRITVSNTGPHIDMNSSELTDIFSLRYRGRGAQHYASEGRGYGLWQAREIASLWGGECVRLVFSHPEPRAETDEIQWARVGFQIEIPVNPDYIVSR